MPYFALALGMDIQHMKGNGYPTYEREMRLTYWSI